MPATPPTRRERNSTAWKRTIGMTNCSRSSRFPPHPARDPAVQRRLWCARERFAVPDGLPIASLIGDSHAALFGQAAFEPGMVKATYGTGSSLMTMTPEPIRSAHGLSSTVAWALPSESSYALEGNITMTGGAIDWFGQIPRRRELRQRPWRISPRPSMTRAACISFRRSLDSAPRIGTMRARGLIWRPHPRIDCGACGARDTRVDCLSGTRRLRRDASDTSRRPSRSWLMAAPAATTR